jgi:hypothetical protein
MSIYPNVPELAARSENGKFSVNGSVHLNIIYSGPLSYDRFDILTTWVTTKILVLTYDPHAGQGHLSYDPHGVLKLQCLWT